MKSLLSCIITAGLFLVILLFLLAYRPAFADYSCQSSSGSCPTNPGTPTTYSGNSTSTADTLKSLAVGAVVVATLVCTYRSIKTHWTTGRLTWCGARQQPLSTIEPYLPPEKNDVTPGNLSDDGQVYIFKGR